MCNHFKIIVITWWRSLRMNQLSHVSSCLKLTWRHLIKRLIRLRLRRKLMSSASSTQYWDTSHPNVPTRKLIKQSSLEGKKAYLRKDVMLAKKKDHNIADCLKEEVLKQVCQNRRVRFGKSDNPISVENSRTSVQCNNDFKVVLDKHMSKNKSTKRQSKNKASRIKHQTCYTCRDKCHLSKH
jgi:hypothetical protein